ncbi:30S ribosomal protein S6 [bacterium BMS3Abin03]|jgi:small subunit ribosomal protein S6|nr:30S ribosomal protein S6 [bacterium BMS3Abin03]MCG6958517.1 30S ribosomal protein S6 [bacterium BMS3Abin03]
MTERIYESAVLLNAALEDEQIQSLISRIKELITTNGGEISEIEDWGRKRLAYMVNKNKIGYYAIFRFNALPDIISKLERFYKLEDNILRYLTIKLSKGALEQMEINKSKSSAEAASENNDTNNAKAEDNESEVIENEQNS